MLPRVLVGFTAYVDGRGYIGRCETVKLPDLAIKGEDFRGAGMDAPVELDMGMEKLDVQITLAEYDPEIIKLFGLFSADTPVVLRGALRRQGEDDIPVVIRCQGGVKNLSRDDWQAGNKSNMQVQINCNRYLEQQNGEELVNIDILNSVRIIGGVDQLAAFRAALGI